MDADFFEEVTKVSEGCWEWPRQRGERYPKVFRGGRRQGVHRWAWELTYGPIPEGILVCHTCDNTRCVRPDHLFIGSEADNREDMYRKRRHRTGEQHGRALVTAKDVETMRELHATGNWSYRELGKVFGLAKPTVGNIIRRDTWT